MMNSKNNTKDIVNENGAIVKTIVPSAANAAKMAVMAQLDEAAAIIAGSTYQTICQQLLALPDSDTKSLRLLSTAIDELWAHCKTEAEARNAEAAKEGMAGDKVKNLMPAMKMYKANKFTFGFDVKSEKAFDEELGGEVISSKMESMCQFEIMGMASNALIRKALSVRNEQSNAAPALLLTPMVKHMSGNTRQLPARYVTGINNTLDSIVQFNIVMPRDKDLAAKIVESFLADPSFYTAYVPYRKKNAAGKLVQSFDVIGIKLNPNTKEALVISGANGIVSCQVKGIDGSVYTCIRPSENGESDATYDKLLNLKSLYRANNAAVYAPVGSSTSGCKALQPSAPWARLNLGEGHILAYPDADIKRDIKDAVHEFHDLCDELMGGALSFMEARDGAALKEGPGQKVVARLSLLTAGNTDLGGVNAFAVYHNKRYNFNALLGKDADKASSAHADGNIFVRETFVEECLGLKDEGRLKMMAQVRAANDCIKAGTVVDRDEVITVSINNLADASTIKVLNGRAEMAEYLDGLKNGAKPALLVVGNYDESQYYTPADVVNGLLVPDIMVDDNSLKLYNNWAEYQVNLMVLQVGGDAHTGSTNSQSIGQKANFADSHGTKVGMEYCLYHLRKAIDKAFDLPEEVDATSYPVQGFMTKKLAGPESAHPELRASMVSKAVESLSNMVSGAKIPVDASFYGHAMPDKIGMLFGRAFLKEDEFYSGKGHGNKYALMRNPCSGGMEHAELKDLSYETMVARIFQVAPSRALAFLALDMLACWPEGALMLNCFPKVHGLLGGHDYDWDGITVYTDPQLVGLFIAMGNSCPLAWDNCRDAQPTPAANNEVNFKEDYLQMLIKYQLQNKIFPITSIGIIANRATAISAMAYEGNRKRLPEFLQVMLAFHPEYREASTEEQYTSVLSTHKVTQLDHALYKTLVKRFLVSDRSWESWKLFLLDCTAFCSAIGGLNLDAVKKQKSVDFYVLPEFLSGSKEDRKVRRNAKCTFTSPIEALSVKLKNIKISLSAAYDKDKKGMVWTNNFGDIRDDIIKIMKTNNTIIDFDGDFKLRGIQMLCKVCAQEMTELNGTAAVVSTFPQECAAVIAALKPILIMLKNIDRVNRSAEIPDSDVIKAIGDTIAVYYDVIARRYGEEKARQVLLFAAWDVYTGESNSGEKLTTSQRFWQFFAPELLRILDDNAGHRSYKVTGIMDGVVKYYNHQSVIDGDGNIGVLDCNAPINKEGEYEVKNGSLLADFGARKNKYGLFALSIAANCLYKQRALTADEAKKGKKVAFTKCEPGEVLRFFAQLPSRLKNGTATLQTSVLHFAPATSAFNDRKMENPNGFTPTYDLGLVVRFAGDNAVYGVQYFRKGFIMNALRGLSNRQDGKVIFDVVSNPYNPIAREEIIEGAEDQMSNKDKLEVHKKDSVTLILKVRQ